MTDLDLGVEPEPPGLPGVLAARHRRALVVGMGGGRASDAPMAKSSFADRPARPPDHDPQRCVDARGRTGSRSGGPPPAARDASPLRLDDALVIPAGTVVRGYLRCRALLLVGDVVGNVHCTAGPVVIRSGACLQGRLVAAGDVYVCGSVVSGEGAGERGSEDGREGIVGRGGAVIVTRGKLTLAPGARVRGDVRSGWLDLHDGAVLQGLARGCDD